MCPLAATFVAGALRKVVHRNPAYFSWSGTSKLSSAVSVWRKRLAYVFKKAKMTNGHNHRFRDTFAVAMLQAGVSLEDVSTLLGHQSLRINQKHYSPCVKAQMPWTRPSRRSDRTHQKWSAENHRTIFVRFSNALPENIKIIGVFRGNCGGAGGNRTHA